MQNAASNLDFFAPQMVKPQRISPLSPGLLHTACRAENTMNWKCYFRTLFFFFSPRSRFVCVTFFRFYQALFNNSRASKIDSRHCVKWWRWLFRWVLYWLVDWSVSAWKCIRVIDVLWYKCLRSAFRQKQRQKFTRSLIIGAKCGKEMIVLFPRWFMNGRIYRFGGLTVNINANYSYIWIYEYTVCNI